jgi:hypothetical protein
MAFMTRGESLLRCGRGNCKTSYGHENVAVVKEWTPQRGHAINLRATRCGGNSEPNGPAMAGKAADLFCRSEAFGSGQ